MSSRTTDHIKSSFPRSMNAQEPVCEECQGTVLHSDRYKAPDGRTRLLRTQRCFKFRCGTPGEALVWLRARQGTTSPEPLF